MEITQGNLAAVFTGLKATFSEAVQSAGTDPVDRIMEVVPSNSGTEQYPVATLLGDLEEVLDEARELAADGVRELVVVAQDTTYYGMDLYGEPRLAELLSSKPI